MTMIQIATIEAPLNRPSLLGPAVGLVRRALALGLLRHLERVERLDLELLRGIAREASSAGIGQNAALALLEGASPARLGALIERLDQALVDSPLPEREIEELLRVFDVEQLASLVGTSEVSLRRYAAGSRSVPDAVAARLHWLAMTTADLAGAYNPLGIRRWFERPRTHLDGRAPRELLGRDWSPDDDQVARVRQLAAALSGAGGAT